MKKLNLHFFAVIFFVFIVANLSAQSVSSPPLNESLLNIQSETRYHTDLKLHKSYIQVSNIKIIESQSISGHVMDDVWRTVAQGLGHSAVIVPQTTLDDTTFFITTDILIISSGVINIPTNRVNTIKSFIMRRKNVYLQCEYLSTYQSNIAFASLVNDLGGTFSWGSTVSGDLQPMQIIGSLSNTPNSVPSIGYYWYGVYGTGNSTIEYFMRYQNNNYGFVFTPTNPNYGFIIADTDQDWVRVSTSVPLMQNILFRLGTITGIQPISNEVPNKFSLSQNYPNPFNPSTKIIFALPNSSFAKIVIYDALGREVETLVNEQLNAGTFEVDFDGTNLASGIYYYVIRTENFTDSKKMILIK